MMQELGKFNLKNSAIPNELEKYDDYHDDDDELFLWYGCQRKDV